MRRSASQMFQYTGFGDQLRRANRNRWLFFKRRKKEHTKIQRAVRKEKKSCKGILGIRTAFWNRRVREELCTPISKASYQQSNSYDQEGSEIWRLKRLKFVCWFAEWRSDPKYYWSCQFSFKSSPNLKAVCAKGDQNSLLFCPCIALHKSLKTSNCAACALK